MVGVDCRNECRHVVIKIYEVISVIGRRRLVWMFEKYVEYLGRIKASNIHIPLDNT
jgi:hypothetical protein